jgi:hypothetical protein
MVSGLQLLAQLELCAVTRSVGYPRICLQRCGAEFMRRVLCTGLVLVLVSCDASSPLQPTFFGGSYELVAGDGAPLPLPLYGVPGGDTTYLLAGVLELVPPDSGLLTLDSKLIHYGHPPELYTSHDPLRYLVRDRQVFIFRREYAEPPTTQAGTVFIGDQLQWTTQLTTIPALSSPQLIDELWFRRN